MLSSFERLRRNTPNGNSRMFDVEHGNIPFCDKCGAAAAENEGLIHHEPLCDRCFAIDRANYDFENDRENAADAPKHPVYKETLATLHAEAAEYLNIQKVAQIHREIFG